MFKKLTAEALGTFVLVFGGCGSAVLAAAFPELGIGFVGVALAFGLTVLTMIYAVGNISGGHFNPAVTFGLAIANRIEWSDVVPYWVAQLVGGFLGAVILYVIASGQAGWTGPGGFAANGFGPNSPGGYGMVPAFAIEVVLTAFFLIVILGATQRGAPPGFAGIAIGLALTLIHLVAIPVTNTAVNPARATAVVFFAQVPEGNPSFLSQLWVFWLAPLVGAAVGGLIWDNMLEND